MRNLVSRFDPKKEGFFERCFEVLRHFYLSIKKEETGKEIGFKYLYTKNKDASTSNVFICLDFEYETFSESHLYEIKEAILKIIELDINSDYLFIITNLSIKGKRLKKDFDEFIDNQSFNSLKFTFLDIYQFVDFISQKSIVYLENKINSANQKYKNEYQLRMSQHFYQESFPFMVDSTKVSRSQNLINHLLQLMHQEREESWYLGNWYFLISEFGYGKTSFLLNSISKIHRQQYLSIFLPVAQFKRSSFTNQGNLIKKILEIILDRPINTSVLFDNLLIPNLRKMLKNRTDIILMFDGLDEHYFAYKLDYLKILFSVVNELCPVCIFTIRSEFWDEKNGNFQAAIGKKRSKKRVFKLMEWESNDIIDYISLIRKEETLNEYLLNFERLVYEKKYDELYGDIPKRPLFLQMLIRDIKIGKLEKTSITKLYENYITEKFLLDRDAVFLKKNKGRPITIPDNADLFQFLESIFRILEEIAIKGVIVIDDEVVLKTYIEENEVQDIIAQSNVKNISELLLNSVLVPFNKRGPSGFHIRFAHKSFHEYFLAKFIYRAINKILTGENTSIDNSLILRNYNKNTYHFLISLVKDSSEFKQQELTTIFLKYSNEVQLNHLAVETNNYFLIDLIEFFNGLAKDYKITVKPNDAYSESNIYDHSITSLKTTEEDKEPQRTNTPLPTVLILTAIQEEYKAVRAFLSNLEDSSQNDTTYESGYFELNGSQIAKVILRECGAKNTNAAQETERAIQYFKPEIMFFVGIAGSRKPRDFQVGDVIFPEKIYSYHGGKSEKETFYTRPDLCGVSYTLLELAKKERRESKWKTILKNGWEENIKADLGVIASGEQIIEHYESDTGEIITKYFNDTSAVEMEGFGFAKAASRQGRSTSNIMIGVVRGISDIIEQPKKNKTDSNEIEPDSSSDRRPEHAKELASDTAAAFTFWLIYKVLKKSK